MVLRYETLTMYVINCAACGRVGFHPSRVGAESRADSHVDETGHDTTVRQVDEPLTD